MSCFPGDRIIVLGVEKKSTAKLQVKSCIHGSYMHHVFSIQYSLPYSLTLCHSPQEPRTVRKIHSLDEHVCLAFAGLTADERVLVSSLKLYCDIRTLHGCKEFCSRSACCAATSKSIRTLSRFSVSTRCFPHFGLRAVYLSLAWILFKFALTAFVSHHPCHHR